MAEWLVAIGVKTGVASVLCRFWAVMRSKTTPRSSLAGSCEPGPARSRLRSPPARAPFRFFLELLESEVEDSSDFSFEVSDLNDAAAAFVREDGVRRICPRPSIPAPGASMPAFRNLGRASPYRSALWL